MAKQKLIPWKEAQRLPSKFEVQYKETGIECPKCGAELYDDMHVLLTYPPQIKILCLATPCDFMSVRCFG